eukprot:353756-Rhodomonas_salina.1
MLFEFSDCSYCTAEQRCPNLQGDATHFVGVYNWTERSEECLTVVQTCASRMGSAMVLEGPGIKDPRLRVI